MDIVAKIKAHLRHDPHHIFDSEHLFRMAIEEIEKVRTENYRLRVKAQIDSGQSVENVDLDRGIEVPE